eukprot:4404844-Amphidinium_carterae.1
MRDGTEDWQRASSQRNAQHTKLTWRTRTSATHWSNRHITRALLALCQDTHKQEAMQTTVQSGSGREVVKMTPHCQQVVITSNPNEEVG